MCHHGPVSEKSLEDEQPLEDKAPVGDYVSVQEAAKILEINDASVRQALIQGRLAFVVRFNRKLISRTVLEEYRGRTQIGQRRGRPKKQE